jgi:hypothetical protein
MNEAQRKLLIRRIEKAAPANKPGLHQALAARAALEASRAKLVAREAQLKAQLEMAQHNRNRVDDILARLEAKIELHREELAAVRTSKQESFRKRLAAERENVSASVRANVDVDTDTPEDMTGGRRPKGRRSGPE